MPDPESADDMVEAFSVVIETSKSWDGDLAWSEVFTIRQTQVVGNVATIVLETDDRVGPRALSAGLEAGFDCLGAVSATLWTVTPDRENRG